jgi:uncharacterized flavoprotein (TIGR03862 family)
MPSARPDTPAAPQRIIAVIGGGPAGLAAAETLAEAGVGIEVRLFERMPTLGRKLLMAGRGGLNLTHSEPLPRFLGRYRGAAPQLVSAIEAFPPEVLRAWCEGLGQPTFVGSSGRVFPEAMKASPFLRAWRARLVGFGVRFALRRRWAGWDESGALRFEDGAGADMAVRPAATVLALGGASWPRLGSDGGWAEILRRRGIAVSVLRPANCGFAVEWSDHLRTRFAGTPLKRIALAFGGETVRGEAMITARGIEGGAVYALSAPIREALAVGSGAVLHIDLRPDLSLADIARKLAAPRNKQSLASFLRKTVGLAPAAIALLHETKGVMLPTEPDALARRIKSLPLRLVAPFGIERAISSAGGIDFAELDGALMLKKLPGVFAAGEMLDWEAPTGGYLLQACFATGRRAAQGALRWLGGEARP